MSKFEIPVWTAEYLHVIQTVLTKEYQEIKNILDGQLQASNKKNTSNDRRMILLFRHDFYTNGCDTYEIKDKQTEI